MNKMLNSTVTHPFLKLLNIYSACLTVKEVTKVLLQLPVFTLVWHARVYIHKMGLESSFSMEAKILFSRDIASRSLVQRTIFTFKVFCTNMT